MSITALPGAPFEFTLTGGPQTAFPSGLVGTIGVQVQDGQGTAVLARHTTGIVEAPAGSAIYTATMAAPLVSGQFSVVCDNGAGVFLAEDLVVGVSGADLDHLRIMVAAETEPVLRDDELAALLAAFSRSDAASRPPSDNAWTPTYDLDAAAAEGWTWKAGRVSDRVDIADEAAQIKRSQLLANIRAMIALYRGRADKAEAAISRPLALGTFPAAEAMPRDSVPAYPWGPYGPGVL